MNKVFNQTPCIFCGHPEGDHSTGGWCDYHATPGDKPAGVYTPDTPEHRAAELAARIAMHERAGQIQRLNVTTRSKYDWLDRLRILFGRQHFVETELVLLDDPPELPIHEPVPGEPHVFAKVLQTTVVREYVERILPRRRGRVTTTATGPFSIGSAGMRTP